MKIREVLFVPSLTGYYFDDQAAIIAGAVPDGLTYRGIPKTSGFRSIRQKGESLSIILILEDEQVAFGDCSSVQYAGTAGRESLFIPSQYTGDFYQEIKHYLKGKEITSFRELAPEFDRLELARKKLHPAIRYGITQALLDAVAKAQKKTMTEVVAGEYGTEPARKPIPIFVQTGDDRYLNADKAIIKRADVLPHALINSIAGKLGSKGEILADYLRWLRNRIPQLGGEDYFPTLHIDVYGTPGIAFQKDLEAIAIYLEKLKKISHPYSLRIEDPVDMGGREKQIETLARLRSLLHQKGISVEIVGDEWCNDLEDIKKFVEAKAVDMIQIKMPDLGGINNSIEAVLYGKEKGVGTYLGGSCNETDRCAQIAVHIALATQPDEILAKSRMGVDEGFMITYNEMQRTLALLRHRAGSGK